MTPAAPRVGLSKHDGDVILPARLAAVSEAEFVLAHLLARAVEGCTVVPGRDRTGGWRQGDAAPDVAWRVTLGDAGRRIDLALDDTACSLLLAPVAEVASLDALDVDLRAAVVACALDPWLTAFEELGGELVTVRGVERPGKVPCPLPGEPATDCLLDVSLTVPDGRRASIRSSCDDAAARTLGQLLYSLPGAPVRAGFHGVRVPVRFELGSSEVSPGELEALEPGDAVLLDRCGYLPDRTIDVLLGRRHRIRGKLADRRVRIALCGDTPLNELQTTETEEGDGSDGLDAIVLQLRFDLGDAEMSVDELSRLKEGRIFDLGGDLDKPVVIRCEGRVVGFGELVEINGERYGVRVLERVPEGG